MLDARCSMLDARCSMLDARASSIRKSSLARVVILLLSLLGVTAGVASLAPVDVDLFGSISSGVLVSIPYPHSHVGTVQSKTESAIFHKSINVIHDLHSRVAG
jgi:hypothetical protein